MRGSVGPRSYRRFLPHKTDKGTFGNTWRVALAENEDALARMGWTTIAQDQGCAAGESAVTISPLHRRHRARVRLRQVEDEIGVINMAIGAARAGCRAMCATSGGGFALMSEALGAPPIARAWLPSKNASRLRVLGSENGRAAK